MKNNKIKRDINLLLNVKREIDLRTKSESNPKPKYNRKSKYKKDHYESE